MKKNVSPFLFFLLSAASTQIAANGADETNPLKTELQELRQQYESRIQSLESRIERMDTGAPAETATMQPGVLSSNNQLPLSNTGSRAKINAALELEFANKTESRSKAILAETNDDHYTDRVESILQNYLNTAGYFRAGFGNTDKGGPQVNFQAPGAGSKYRLGNEADNFGEIVFSKNIYNADRFSTDPAQRSSGGPVAHFQTRIEFFNPHEAFSSGSATDVGLPEAWASFGNIFASQPTAKIWAGNRFYRRHDIHVYDFKFWNMSGGGGGIEDVMIGEKTKFAAAWIGWGSTSGLTSTPTPDPENEAGFSKRNIDLRVYDLPLWGGEAEIGLIYSRVKSGLDADGNQAADTDGVSVNFVHTLSNFISEDGSNVLSVQYGTEAAKNFLSSFETYTSPIGTFIRPDNPDSWRFRITESFTANINDNFSIGPVLIYQHTDYAGNEGDHTWISAGVRPIYHFSESSSIAFEGGMDYVSDDFADTSDTLYKLTIAPQFSLGDRFNSRPVIRVYATYAKWGDDFKGQVGGRDFINETSGMNYGIQMETWW